MPYDWNLGGNINPAARPIPGGNIVGASAFAENTNHGKRMQADAFYSDLLLEMKRYRGEDLKYASYAGKYSIKKGNKQINLRRYKPLKAHITPLVEGLPPVADRAEGKAIVAQTNQYGRYMEFTDLFDYKVMDPVISEYTMELGALAAETIDMLAQAALLAEGQVFFPAAATKPAPAGGTVTTTAELVDAHETNPLDTIPTFDDLRVIKLTMEVASIKSIGGLYKVLVSPSVFFDLQTDPTVKQFMDYGNTNSAIARDMIPDVYGLSVTKAATAKTEMVKGTNESAMVHYSIVLGAKAYARVDIAGGDGIQYIQKGLGSAGTNDPLNQRHTIGWKIMAIGFKVIEPDAVVIYPTIPTQAETITNNFDYVTEKASEIGITLEMAKQAKTHDVDGFGNPTITEDVSDQGKLDKLTAAAFAKQTGLNSTTANQFADVEHPSTNLTKALNAHKVSTIKEDPKKTP